MFKLSGTVLLVFIICNFEYTIGSKFYHKWVPMNSGDPLPENVVVVLIDDSSSRYVGRARHFDEILPAEVNQNGTASIFSCNKEIPKNYFEILTISKNCEWIYYSDYNEMSENIVRGGTAWNGEPIYIGKSYCYNSDSLYHISGISLNSRTTHKWSTKNSGNYGNNEYYSCNDRFQYLSCESKNNWVDTSSTKVPNNTISGGKSEEEYEIHVARLKRGCEVVTGQVIPDMGTSTAFLNDGQAIEAAYCQVLVGEMDDYKWVSASDGEIPDYAVANGKENYELSYVVRFNKTITHMTHSKALESLLDYEVLVINQ